MTQKIATQTFSIREGNITFGWYFIEFTNTITGEKVRVERPTKESAIAKSQQLGFVITDNLTTLEEQNGK